MPSTPNHPHEDRRFVVLRHVRHADTHFDLMIDTGERLATWRCPNEPDSAADQGMVCERIGEHRRIYLDYQGPVSGDRGYVHRYDRGTCAIHRRSNDRWELTFRGRKLQGRHVLARLDTEGQSWSLRPV